MISVASVLAPAFTTGAAFASRLQTLGSSSHPQLGTEHVEQHHSGDILILVSG